MLLIAAAAVAATAPPDLSWLAGYWLTCEGGKEVSETWSDPRAGMLNNTTLTLNKGKLTVEIASIRMLDGKPVFHAQPPGEQPTDFPAKTLGKTSVVFENLAHDFPQRVSYSRSGEVLTAFIEGTMNGKTGRTSWVYRARPLNSRCPKG